jgi:predicted AAA+ superfamily ATPase
VLEDLLNIVSSSIGSLTNPTKLSNAFGRVKNRKISSATINSYLNYFVDAFVISKSFRYDVKGKKYMDTPMKYYFTDVGLRNAQLNFRQLEENRIMENIIYNELATRGFDVDAGVVEYNYKDAARKSRRSQLEVDFVANQVSKRYYIQSAFLISDDEKRNQEINPLRRIPDSFRKIVIVKGDIVPYHDENGILNLGIEKFLLDESSMDF